MAFREVTMLEVKEILRLWLVGVPKKRIVHQLGCSRCSSGSCHSRK